MPKSLLPIISARIGASGIVLGLLAAPQYSTAQAGPLRSAVADLATSAIDGPVDVVMICADMGAYDFAQEAFTVDSRSFETSCTDAGFQSFVLPARTRFEIAIGRAPSSAPMTPADAEDLRRQVGNDALGVGFPGRIDARVEPGGQPVILYDGQRTGP